MTTPNPTPIKTPVPVRPAQGPMRDGAQSSIAVLIAGTLASMVVAANPGLGTAEIAITAAGAGILGGLGNYSRTRGGLAKAILGWLG